MNKMIRKIITLILCVTLCFSMAACGQISAIAKPTESSEIASNVESELEESSEPINSEAVSEIVSGEDSSTAESCEEQSSETSSEDSRHQKKQNIQKKMSPFQFKTEASRHRNNLGYSDILRNVSQYTDISVTFQGTVVDINRDPNGTTGLIARDDNMNNEKYIVCFSFDEDPGILKGDYIYIYGYPVSMTTYTNTERDSRTTQEDTILVDVYYYDMYSQEIDDYQLTQEEKKYFYGDYSVTNAYSGESRIIHVDEKTIDGHPYNVTKCTKQSDGSIDIYFQFVEDLESYAHDKEKDPTDLQPGSDDLTFSLNNKIYLSMHSRAFDESINDNRIKGMDGFGFNIRYAKG
jgi:hypothetical protein